MRKAYDSVDHKVLLFVLQMHKSPVTLVNAIMKAVKGTSTRLVADTKTGKETSSPIHLKKALLQGESLCLRLFTISVLEPPSMEDKNNERVHIKQANPS